MPYTNRLNVSRPSGSVPKTWSQVPPRNTGGANRWLPAKPPVPWQGELHTLIYGPNCPQTLHDFKAIETSFLFDWDDGYLGEDMLKLNIWTSGLSGKRPVMVYFHGGGFSFGSAYELPSHEGAQMARHHDVVQVSAQGVRVDAQRRVLDIHEMRRGVAV